MDELKPIDLHAHIDLNYEMVPPAIYIKRKKWNLNAYERTVLKWGYKHPVAVWLLLVPYNIFVIFFSAFRGKKAARTVHVREILNFYFSKDPKKRMIKEMDKAGIYKAVALHIDHRLQDKGEAGEKRYQAALWYNLKAALTTRRFISTQGVTKLPGTIVNPYQIAKIYPALFDNEAQLLEVLNTVDKAIIHCSAGGIGNNTDLNHPGIAAKALETNPDLVICFAHFGGGRVKWREAILRLMAEYRKPDGTPRVYAGFSFHEDVVFNPQKVFGWLRRVLDDPLTGDCVVFGSDYPLHTAFYSYKAFVDACKKNLGPWLWELISCLNSRRFLES